MPPSSSAARNPQGTRRFLSHRSGSFRHRLGKRGHVLRDLVAVLRLLRLELAMLPLVARAPRRQVGGLPDRGEHECEASRRSSSVNGRGRAAPCGCPSCRSSVSSCRVGRGSARAGLWRQRRLDFPRRSFADGRAGRPRAECSAQGAANFERNSDSPARLCTHEGTGLIVGAIRAAGCEEGPQRGVRSLGASQWLRLVELELIPAGGPLRARRVIAMPRCATD
jgi:hypothetical protein